jgi:predicted transcriptional regulator
MFHWENSYKPPNELILRSRSYRKVAEDEVFANIGMINIPSDTKKNKLDVLKYFSQYSDIIKPKKHLCPRPNPVIKQKLSKTDKKIYKAREMLLESKSVNLIAKTIGMSWNFVNSIKKELVDTGGVTLKHWHNPYLITPEGKAFVVKYYEERDNTGKSSTQITIDYTARFPNRKIKVIDARLILKNAGYRFYRSSWIKLEYYKAPATKSEILQGARIWISLFNSQTWVTTFDEFEIMENSIPYSFWAKRVNYEKMLARNKSNHKFFVQCAIDMAGVVAFNIFEESISSTEKTQFFNEVARIYHNLIENEELSETDDERRILIGEKKIIWYVDRAAYNTSAYVEDILDIAPYLQFAVRSTAKYNPVEQYNSIVKFEAKRLFYRLADKQ